MSADAAARVGRLLSEGGRQLVCAESCTGGGVATALTAVAGSSSWLWGGVVSYSIASKIALLDVPSQLIEQHGAVSEPVACAMAEGALARSGAELAVAVTGIAGPGGGEILQPVGTVWFAWLMAGGYQHTAREIFPGDRGAVREAAVQTALSGLLRILERPENAG